MYFFSWNWLCRSKDQFPAYGYIQKFVQR
jgi:hypothetical protein